VSDSPRIGRLGTVPARTRPDLVAEAVTTALAADATLSAHVAEIDPGLADTAQFCAAYDVPAEVSANCVVVAGRRGGDERVAACLVLATTRADVNGIVRKHVDARKVSFASMDTAVSLTAMEYGGITPIGLPAEWPILVDQNVIDQQRVIIGSGIRSSKLLFASDVLAALPGAEVLALTKAG
jgi:prolyl-tRNA editing enzyme YbaK/EbsC (Cys-tRNA(Pro) deacylase)